MKTQIPTITIVDDYYEKRGQSAPSDFKWYRLREGRQHETGAWEYSTSFHPHDDKSLPKKAVRFVTESKLTTAQLLLIKQSLTRGEQ